jgi:hypothetical protein
MSIVTAQIRLNGTVFVAELSEGQRIERGTLNELAEALHAAGVTAETAHCGDWRDGEQILGAGQQIALKAELRRLAGLDHVIWTTAGFDAAGGTITLNLRQVDTLTYRGLAVPVWQLLPDQGNYSSSPFVRREDLPADLAEAFFDRWQYGANQPFADGAYHYDFDIFMSRGGRPGDAEIVARYR